MNYYSPILFVFLFLSAFCVQAQDDPVLFTVEGDEVTVSEFRYIYEKNNGDKADYGRESLEEYLELYKRFKLKVQRAKTMGLDTITALQDELEGYRKQLANSYLTDKEVSGRLMEEAAERMLTDVSVSHIFIPNPKKGMKDDGSAKNTIDQIYIKLQQGKFFEDVALKESKDEASAGKGGKLGYYTAPLPSGFYNFENAMYTTEVGTFSKPIETKMGWHILKVNDKRPSKGEREIAHLLIRKKVKGEAVTNALTVIDSLYNLLANGADFDELTKANSQDQNTASKEGYLGFVKINQFEKAFEEAVFGLENDGDISSPVESKIGYHIVKRISAVDYSDKEKNKRRVKSKLSKDDRLEIAKKSLIEKIKEEAGLTEDAAVYAAFVRSLTPEFYSYKWQLPDVAEKTLLSFNNGMTYTNKDFALFCKKNTRARLKYNKDEDVSVAAQDLYNSYLDEVTIKFEEANLEKKYPDFKALMREYEEGILLFEATKQEVWDKATEDTIGLQNFYASNKENYRWDERAELTSYSIANRDAKTMAKLKKCLAKGDTEKLLSKFNTEAAAITTESKIIEKSALGGMDWKKGALSAWDESDRNVTKVNQITRIIPSSLKSFDEARGYIIADYQDFLEKEWVASLKESYKLQLNEDVFSSLIRK